MGTSGWVDRTRSFLLGCCKRELRQIQVAGPGCCVTYQETGIEGHYSRLRTLVCKRKHEVKGRKHPIVGAGVQGRLFVIRKQLGACLLESTCSRVTSSCLQPFPSVWSILYTIVTAIVLTPSLITSSSSLSAPLLCYAWERRSALRVRALVRVLTAS